MASTKHPGRTPGILPRRTRATATWLAACAGVLLAAGCGGGRAGDASRAPAPAPGAGPPPQASSAPRGDASPAEARPRVVVLGDSLTAGYGLPNRDVALPALLQQDVDAAGLPYQVVDMGVSGDTTAGGLRRLDWAMEGEVHVLVVALGGNDGLRGLAPAQMRANLAAIIDSARARGTRVLLCGMEAPPNLGPQYTREFRAVYRSLAKEKGVTLVPFLLDGIAGLPEFNQPDGIHPNEAGARRMASLVWAALRPMLEAGTTS